MAGQEPEFPSPPARSMPHSILTAGGILLVIAGLYFGRELFIPFTLAVLLAFALSPIINALRRWRVPRVPAVILTVILAFSVIGGLSYVLSTQVIKLAESIPRYQYTMINKIDSIFDSGAAGGLFERLTSTVERLRSRLAENEETSQLGSPAQPSEQGQEAPEPIPIGKAALRREGKDLAIITWGAFVHYGMRVATKLAADGIECSVLDLRTLVPLDREAILSLVRRCNRVMIIHEDTRTGSVGESIAAIIQEEAFEYLDAPVRIIGSLDTPVPYSPPLEEEFLPSEDEIEAAARELVKY